jgi:hypothetical protein
VRTMLTIAALATLPLAACTDDSRDTEPKRPTRIVCTDQSGRRVHDDFASSDSDVSPVSGFITYKSATQEGYARVSGQCVTYPQTRAPVWKPVIQGLPG